MKNWKTAATLALVVLALGGLATWDEWQTKKEEKAKETSNRLVTLNPDDVISIDFLNHGDAEAGGDKTPEAESQSTTKVEAKLLKKDEKWVIESPIAADADQQVIKDMLKNIADYKYESEIASSKENWPTYGLTTPRRSLTMKFANGSEMSVYVGNNAPVGYTTYVASSTSDKVFGGSQYIGTSLGKSLFDLRDKKVVDVNSLEVESFEIQLPSKNKLDQVVTAKKNNGKWIVGADVDADTAQINNFLDDVTAIKASEFIDSPTKELIKSRQSKSDADQVASVTLLTTKGERKLQAFSHKNGVYLATNSGQIVKVGDDVKAKLTKSTNDFRNKKIFAFTSADVESIEVDGTSFSRVKDEWYTADDAQKFAPDGLFKGKEDEKPAPSSHIRGLLVDLEFGKAEEIIADPAKVKLDPAPQHSISINFAGSTKKEKLKVDFWKVGENPEQIYVKHSAGPAIYKAKSALISSISPASKAPAGEEFSPAPPASPTP